MSSRFRADHLRPRALTPDFQLLDGSRAKRICGTQQGSFSLRSKNLSQLANRCRLAGSVYTYNQNYLGGAVDFLQRLAVRRGSNSQQPFFQEPLKLIDILNLLSIALLPQLTENIVICVRHDVGADPTTVNVTV